MDPDANLASLLNLATRLIDDDATDADDVQRLAELVLALDGWIKIGGFLPARWTSKR